MGSRVLIARVVARLAASFLAVFVVVLIALDAAEFAYLARVQHDLLEPLLGTAEGRAVYDAALRRIGIGLALLDLPLLLVVGAASYVLALFAVRPLVEAREREARFAAEAAHELRTPLARIAGLTQSPPPDALERIARIAVDAAQTVGDLLTLVREETVAARLSEPVDLASVARTAVAELARDGVRYDVAASDGAWVVGDERRLRRLADNLIENASRHAAGTVRVEVASAPHAVVLSVEDDGPGVSDAVRARIFGRFVRGSDDKAGTGLGLAICRTIARAHGGDLTLEGRNRFVARLPPFEV